MEAKEHSRAGSISLRKTFRGVKKMLSNRSSINNLTQHSAMMHKQQQADKQDYFDKLHRKSLSDGDLSAKLDVNACNENSAVLNTSLTNEHYTTTLLHHTPSVSEMSTRRKNASAFNMMSLKRTYSSSSKNSKLSNSRDLPMLSRLIQGMNFEELEEPPALSADDIIKPCIDQNNNYMEEKTCTDVVGSVVEKDNRDEMKEIINSTVGEYTCSSGDKTRVNCKELSRNIRDALLYVTCDSHKVLVSVMCLQKCPADVSVASRGDQMSRDMFHVQLYEDETCYVWVTVLCVKVT